MSLWCLSSSFSSIWLIVWEEMWFEEFQDGANLWYQNGTILAILNIYVALMPPIKLWLNPTYGLGGDSFEEFQRPSWISGRNDFSNSESLCPSDASHQVSAQSNLRFRRRCCLKNFKMATLAAILDIGAEWLLAILNLHVATMPPTKFVLNPTYGSGEDVKNVKS